MPCAVRCYRESDFDSGHHGSTLIRGVSRSSDLPNKKLKLASISPITSGTLRELGFEPAAEAKEYTMVGVVEAIKASP